MNPEADALLAPWEDRPELAICFDRQRTLLAVNTGFARKFGLAASELQGQRIADFIHPEDVADWSIRGAQLEMDWKPIQREHRWKTAQGWRWLAWEEAWHFDYEGRPSMVVAVARDVTRRRLAEEHFAKLAQAVEQSPVAIVMTTLDGVVQYVNPAYTEATGYTLEEIFDRNIQVLNEGHPSPESILEFQKTIAAGRAWQGELKTRRKDGSTLWERVEVSPIRGANAEIAHLLCRREDITIQKNLELQLHQAQKMESLGTLASGIAHDFNNILAIIRGFSELLHLRGNLDEASLGKVRKILEASNRASDLIRRILTFSRKGEVSFRPIRINAQIEEFARLLRETFPRNIQLELDLDPGLPRIPADPAQMQQVVLNLCVNARDAMKNGGRLRIRTARIPGSSLSHLTLEPACDYVLLEVTDTGAGIPPAVASRIFEPFFTTKEKAGGTGLGLSVVYGIVTNHSGTIDLCSTPGEGTTFSVYLPIKELKEAPADLVEDETFPPGVERLAIVDDEPAIRDLLTAAFQSRGYVVHALDDGQAVREAIVSRTFDHDAIILDLDMPHVNGFDVLDELRAAFPQMPVVIITGHLDAEARSFLDQMKGVSYLLKPFHLNALGSRVRRLLDLVKLQE